MEDDVKCNCIMALKALKNGAETVQLLLIFKE
jgi:hypothetical protein